MSLCTVLFNCISMDNIVIFQLKYMISFRKYTPFEQAPSPFNPKVLFLVQTTPVKILVGFAYFCHGVCSHTRPHEKQAPLVSHSTLSAKLLVVLPEGHCCVVMMIDLEHCVSNHGGVCMRLIFEQTPPPHFLLQSKKRLGHFRELIVKYRSLFILK